MKTKTTVARWRRSVPLSILTTLLACQAQAVTFNLGEVNGSFDSTLSIGTSMALRNPDKAFIGRENGGTAFTTTSDDGRLNFRKHDVISTIFKGVHDLELKYGDAGLFVRGKYWYDFELKDGSQRLYDIDDRGRVRSTRTSGAEFLDAFVYTGYRIGDYAGTVRLGKQVVNWGENLFIQGISQINPIDVAAFRRPGAEIKEGLIPVNMFYVAQDLSANLSMEAFYQLKWAPMVLDNCGTFFAGSDTVAKGCNDRNLAGGSDIDPANPGIPVPRLRDRDARDNGQFGVALRWFVPQLNDAELGFYALNVHSRVPVYSMYKTTDPFVDPGLSGNAPSTRYFFEYPEDIRLYGLSFQVNVGTTAVAGEFSYQPNMPLALNSTDLTYAALGIDDNYGIVTPSAVQGGVAAPGAYLVGYKRMPVSQVQLSAIHLIEQVAGAQRLALAGEIAYNRIMGLKSGPGELRFGRDSIYGLGEYDDPGFGAPCEVMNGSPRPCNGKGYYTSGSWGYRMSASLDYSNIFAGINLSPEIAWSHDVEGYGPNFIEGAKSVYLALNANYLNRYSATLSYTDFFGGRYNPNTDRDYVAFSVSASF